MENMKINLHITEKCNYHCKHCFARYEPHNTVTIDGWKHIISNIAESGLFNEINITGGEPLLVPHLIQLASFIHEQGMSVSMITNGQRMTDQWILEHAHLFSCIGFSADSFHVKTIHRIGRCTKAKSYVSGDRLSHNMKLLKETNPDIRIKLNTVVSGLNCFETPATELVRTAMPLDRWKILKMHPFVTAKFDNRFLSISDEDYTQFCIRNLSVIGTKEQPCSILKACYHAKKSNMAIIPEQDMYGSYLMIDAGGYLIDNTSDTGYLRIGNTAEEPIAELLPKLHFYKKKYMLRYV